MRTNNIILVAALAVGSLLVLNTALPAQDSTNTPPSGPPAGGPPGGPGFAMRRMPSFDTIAKQLELTDDQKPKVKAILDDRDKQRADLFQDQDMSREDRMAKLKSIRDDTDTKLKAVLTPDQFDKWQKMQSRMRAPRNGQPPGGNTNTPPANPPA